MPIFQVFSDENSEKSAASDTHMREGELIQVKVSCLADLSDGRSGKSYATLTNDMDLPLTHIRAWTLNPSVHPRCSIPTRSFLRSRGVSVDCPRWGEWARTLATFDVADASAQKSGPSCPVTDTHNRISCYPIDTQYT